MFARWCLVSILPFFFFSCLNDYFSQRNRASSITATPWFQQRWKVFRLRMTSTSMTTCCCYKSLISPGVWLADVSRVVRFSKCESHRALCLCVRVVVIFSTYIKLSVSESKAVWAIVLHYGCSCLDDASNLSALFTAGCNLHPFTQMKIHECRGRAFLIQDQGRNLHFLLLSDRSRSRASFFILIYTCGMESDGIFKADVWHDRAATSSVFTFTSSAFTSHHWLHLDYSVCSSSVCLFQNSDIKLAFMACCGL